MQVFASINIRTPGGASASTLAFQIVQRPLGRLFGCTFNSCSKLATVLCTLMILSKQSVFSATSEQLTVNSLPTNEE